jgi:choline kinase
MKALILAAGLGERLGELTKDRPKALVQAAGRELIAHALDFLNHPSVTDKAVVTGYCAEKLSAFLAEKAPEVKTFYNPDFRLGSIRSLESAISFLDDEFLLLNVDHIYPKRMLPVILKGRKGLTAVCDFDRKLFSDDMKVKLSKSGALLRIMKTLTDYNCGYIGMTYCDSQNLSAYRDAITQTRSIYGDKAPVEWVLGHLAANQKKISICDASGIGWLEVDTQEDLNFANKKLGEDRNFLK